MQSIREQYISKFCGQFEEQVKNCEGYETLSNKLRERYMQDKYRQTHCLYFQNALALCQSKILNFNNNEFSIICIVSLIQRNFYLRYGF